MCGRYQFDKEIDAQEIYDILDNLNKNKYNTNNICPTAEVRPTDSAPILAKLNNKISIQPMHWGFKKWDNKGVIINAKSETADSKKMFSAHLYSHRCVILSTGFYEWNNKQKYLFSSPKSSMLYMAGLYNQSNGISSFVILTQSANKYISDIHDRMPVILNKDDIKQWINDELFIKKLFTRSDVLLQRNIVNTK